MAIQHNDSYNESIYSFVNNIITPEGGTHMAGFRSALTKIFNDYARKNKLLKDSEENLSGDDIREGMTAIISIKIEDPQFEGQTKQKLGNSEARSAVDSVVSEQLVYLSLIHIFLPDCDRNTLSATSIAFSPLIRTMPIPELPKAVDMAAIVFSLISSGPPFKKEIPRGSRRISFFTYP